MVDIESHPCILEDLPHIGGEIEEKIDKLAHYLE